MTLYRLGNVELRIMPGVAIIPRKRYSQISYPYASRDDIIDLGKDSRRETINCYFRSHDELDKLIEYYEAGGYYYYTRLNEYVRIEDLTINYKPHPSGIVDYISMTLKVVDDITINDNIGLDDSYKYYDLGNDFLPTIFDLSNFSGHVNNSGYANIEIEQLSGKDTIMISEGGENNIVAYYRDDIDKWENGWIQSEKLFADIIGVHTGVFARMQTDGAFYGGIVKYKGTDNYELQIIYYPGYGNAIEVLERISTNWTTHPYPSIRLELNYEEIKLYGEKGSSFTEGARNKPDGDYTLTISDYRLANEGRFGLFLYND